MVAPFFCLIHSRGDSVAELVEAKSPREYGRVKTRPSAPSGQTGFTVTLVGVRLGC
jgi:hypothetical protein